MAARLIMFIILLANGCAIHAQNTFIHAIEGRTFIFVGDYAITHRNWPLFFPEGQRPLQYNTDSLVFGSREKRGEAKLHERLGDKGRLSERYFS